jgi:phenylalanyl-tRNA synthetase beta chain
MKFDSTWLLGHLEGDTDPDVVAGRLTDCGFLVELREPGNGSEIWDVEVTTNRPDAMNHRGLAREAAVATGSKLRPLTIEVSEDGEATADLASVAIADADICSRFAARVVCGVHQVPSPEWLRRRLVNCGVRPINAVVDVTNYVLLELGQPLHAYDLAKVRGRALVARRAAPGETLTTLDGEKRELDVEMAVIGDGEGVVGLAGIMGGANSEIDEHTSDVLLEAAHFDPLTVRRTARRLGLHTEASHRFERGADPAMPPLAVDLAAAMMAELAGGRVCRGRIDVLPRVLETRQMEVSISALSAFAGLEIPAERVLQILEGLEFSPRFDGDFVRATVPSHRVDIDVVPDLYEEVIRHVGYAAIPSRLPVLPATPGRRNSNWELVDRARSAAVGAGLVEIMTWSFVDPETDTLVKDLALCSGGALPLVNPLAQTQSVMRRSLMPGMLGAASANFNQGEQVLAIFEQGRVFNSSEAGPEEHERLGIVLSEDSAGREITFARLKGILVDVVTRAGLPPLDWRPGGAPWLDAAAGANLVTADGAVVGVAGLLSTQYERLWDLRRGVAIAEVDLGLAAEPPQPRFEGLARHPAVTVDMTVEHSVSLSYAVLEEAVLGLAGDWVEELGYVTRFVPESDDRTIRTTVRLVYRHPDRSLTQEEVNAAHQALRRKLADSLAVGFA